MIRKFCIAAIQLLLLSLLVLSGNPAYAGVHSETPEHAFAASANRLMEEVFHVSAPRRYLLEYTEDGDLEQQYVNGAQPLYSDAIKAKMLASLEKFNTENSSKKIKLFAFTGRYYLGYSDPVKGLMLTDKQQKVYDALLKALQKENGAKGSKDVFRKAFIQAVEEKYDEFLKKSASLQMEKTLVLFYIEAVMPYDYYKDKEIITAYKKRYYCFVWSKGLDVFEKSKISNAFPELKQLIQLSTTGLKDPATLVACIDKVSSLYKSTDDYDSPAGAISFLWSLSAEEQQNLTLEQRVRLLKAINKAPRLTDGNNLPAYALGNPGASGEEAVITLLNTTPGKDADRLLDNLNTIGENSETLLISFYKKLDDGMVIGAGMPNRSRYLKAIDGLIKSGPSFSGRVIAMLDDPDFPNRCIHWDPSYAGEGAPLGANQYEVTMDNDGTVHVQRKYVIDHDLVDVTSRREDAIPQIKAIPKFNTLPGYPLKPLDLVIVYNNSGLKALSDADILPNDLKIVPALSLKLIREKEFNDDVFTAIMAATDAATVLGGPAKIVSATSKARRAWIMFEIANSCGNLLLNAAKSELQDTKFETVLQLSNLVVGVVGGYELLNGSIHTVPQAFRAAQQLTGTLRREIAIRFIAAVMRVEAELVALKNTGKAKQLFALRDAVLREWKAVYKENLEEAAIAYNAEHPSGTPEPEDPVVPAPVPPTPPVRHPNWVEVLDIRTKLLNREPHVLRIDHITTNSSGTSGFTGCHSKIALDGYVVTQPGATVQYRSKVLATNGVYEANPVIVMPDGTEYVKLNNGGKSSFFPDSWDRARILDEVEYAVANNHGRYVGGSANEYYGLSRDGTVEIHFYLNINNGNINSFFPKLVLP